MKVKKRNSSALDVTLKTVVAVILIIYTLSILAMLLWGLINSFKSGSDFRIDKIGFPTLERSSDELKFGNYIYIFEKFSFRRVQEYYSLFGLQHHERNVSFLGLCLNTVILAGAGSLLCSFFPMFVGYLCAKYKYKFSSILYWTVVVVMAIPSVGVYPAELQMLRALNLYDTIPGHLLQKSYFTGMYFLVFYAFFSGVDNGYIEAAEIDGASELRIMFSIIFPLALKMFSSVLIINFVTLWNDYQVAVLYMPTYPTLAYGVWRVAYGSNDGFISNIPTKLAACMTLALPITILYAVFRDKLMGNLSMGGLKG